jgi:hypothetical protein
VLKDSEVHLSDVEYISIFLKIFSSRLIPNALISSNNSFILSSNKILSNNSFCLDLISLLCNVASLFLLSSIVGIINLPEVL